MFSALPSGNGNASGSFNNVGNNDASNAYSRGIYYYGEVVYRLNDFKSFLQSVRCVKD